MNERFRVARERTPSPAGPHEAASRQELAELVRQWVLRHRRRETAIDEVHIGKIERGEISWPNADYRAALRAVLGVESDSELGFVSRRASRRLDRDDASPEFARDDVAVANQPQLPPPPDAPDAVWNHVTAPDVDGIEAIELIRRVEASDTGSSTLAAIGAGVDRLCRSYTHTAPAELLVPAQAYQNYIARLLDARARLAQRRELMRHAGWLSLLIATADIDLGRHLAAAANFRAAHTIATEIGDEQLAAWVFETQAWEALSSGLYRQAADLCRAGMEHAPPDTSAYAQLLTQSARVSARLGLSGDTHRLVDECVAVLDRLPPPEQPEDHFVCDPRRAVAYSAAALVWLGDDDDLTEEYARQAVAQYETDACDGRWVHRLALARINLALLLARNDEPAEAAHLGARAFASSWRLVRTDLFLSTELDQSLAGQYPDVPDVINFHNAYMDTIETIGRLAREEPLSLETR